MAQNKLRSRKKSRSVDQIKHTTLVLEPTPKQPWIGIFSTSGQEQKKTEHFESGTAAGNDRDTKKSLPPKRRYRLMARQVITRLSPSQVDYWSALNKIKKYFPPDQILVITGPGPFSFTRTAVNIANALAFGWDVPVVGISRAKNSRYQKMSILNILSTVLPPGQDLIVRSLKNRKNKEVGPLATDNFVLSDKFVPPKKFVLSKRALPFYPKKAY